MNPAQANKIDLSVSLIKNKSRHLFLRVSNLILTQRLSEEERKLFRMYGKLPDGKDLLGHKLKVRIQFLGQNQIKYSMSIELGT
jgi:hypothetical protein